MAEKPAKKFAFKEATFTRDNPPDRYPTNEELLADLRPTAAKPTKPRDLPLVSRRTKDFLLTAGLGSAGIVFALAKFMTQAEAPTIVRLSLTAIGVFCALLWYIFYGVMSRY